MSSLLNRLSWLCLAMVLVVLAAFALYLPPSHARFSMLFKMQSHGAWGIMGLATPASFVAVALGLAAISLLTQFRLRDRAAAAIIHLLIFAIAMFIWMLHREAIFQAVTGLRCLVK